MTITLSCVAGAGAQFFDNNGSPLSGGKLYIYAAGTTTPSVTYTSASGNTPNTNPIVLDAAGRVSEEIWLVDGNSYKFVLKTANDQQIWSHDDISNGTDILLQLANTTDVAKGDALVGFRQSDASGALSNAVARTVHQKLQEIVSAADFGAIGDWNGTTGTDNTAFIQNAIDAVYASGGGILYFNIGQYKLTGTITLRPGVSIIGEQKGEWGAGFTPGVGFVKAFTTGNVFESLSTQTIASVVYENFWIDGKKGGIGGANGSGFVIELCHDVIFRQVWVDQCPSSGFVIGKGSASYHNYFYNCYSFFNGAVGYLVQSDWMRFIDCWADGNYIGIEFPNNAYCGAFAHIERCHFEEFELAAIAIRGNPSVGANGNNQIRDCVIFSRPYQNTWPAHGIYVETVNGAGASGNQITGNFITYQSTYGPTKSGHYGIYWAGGGASGSNIIENNEIGGFDYGINLIAGTVRNIVSGNSVDGCNLGMNNNASLTTITQNIFTNNTSDLSDTGSSGIVANNYFSVAPTLALTDYASNNNAGSIGSFTPNLRFGGANTGITYSYNQGRWEKNGHTVNAFYQVELSNKGSATGTAEFDLPVNAGGLQSPAMVWIYANGVSITGPVFGYVNPSNSRFTLLQGTGAGTFLTDANFANNTKLLFHITYQTA